MSMHRRSAWLVALLLASAACATPGTTIISGAMIVPPDRLDVARYRDIAVLPFDGPTGVETADVLARVLSGSTFKGGQVFTLTDYRKLQDLAADKYDSAMSPPLNRDTLQELGRALNVKGIYTGKVLVAAGDTTFSRDRVSNCAEFDIVKNRCIRETQIMERCNGAESRFSANIRLVDVATGRIVHEMDVAGEANDKNCTNQDVTNASRKQTFAGDVLEGIIYILTANTPSVAIKTQLDVAREKAFQRILKVAAPSVAVVGIELKNPGSDLVSREAREKVRQGLEAMQRNDWMTACRLWTEARALQQEAPTILFDLGVCAEVQEHFKEAEVLFKKAAALSNDPEAYAGTALKRIETRLANKDLMEWY